MYTDFVIFQENHIFAVIKTPTHQEINLNEVTRYNSLEIINDGF